MRVIKWEGYLEYRFGRGILADPPLEFAHVGEVDVLLKNDQSVERDDPDFGRQLLETALEHRILKDPALQRLERCGHRGDRRVVRPSALASFEFSDMIICRPPLGRQLAKVRRLALDPERLDEAKILTDGRAPDEKDVIIESLGVCCTVRFDRR